MGKEIWTEEHDRFPKISGHLDSNKIQSLSRMLNEMRSLGPNELRMLFETLFSRMSAGSKEAMVEVLWAGLNVSEQQSFELPYFGSR